MKTKNKTTKECCDLLKHDLLRNMHCTACQPTLGESLTYSMDYKSVFIQQTVMMLNTGDFVICYFFSTHVENQLPEVYFVK